MYKRQDIYSRIRPEKEFSGRISRILWEFFNFIEVVEHQPKLGKVPHDIPDADAVQLVFAGQRKLGADRTGVLEPDLVLGTVAPVIIMRRLGGFVELDGRADLDRLLDRLNIAEAPCARLSFYIGEKMCIRDSH